MGGILVGEQQFDTVDSIVADIKLNKTVKEISKKYKKEDLLIALERLEAKKPSNNTEAKIIESLIEKVLS